MSVIDVEFPGNISQVDSAADLRALPTALIPNKGVYLVSDLGVFVYASASFEADNSLTVLKPNDRTPLQAGRWVISGDDVFASAAQVDGLSEQVDLAANFQQQAAGSIVRTVRTRLAETISIADFDADPGNVDNTAAIQAAIDAAFARGGGEVYLPRGDFRIAGTLQGKPGVSIIGQGSLASRLLKIGAGDCLVYGTGTGGGDADQERVLLQGFSLIGQPASGSMFWGRKATTAFAMRDLYAEGGNSTIKLDSCYSLLMDNVQVRGAETGHNITLGAISHNVTLIQVASQVAKAGAGLAMFGCYTVAVFGGKLEFNARDQWLVGTGCRGISAFGLYIEGIQPSASGYAGVQFQDVDTFLWLGGLLDATQGGAVGTGSIAGTTLTVSATSSGNVYLGGRVTGAGVAANTVVTTQVSGTPNGVGVYTVNNSQAVAPTTLRINGGGPIGTDGTGTYFKVSGAASRVHISDYGFVSIDQSQTHVEFGSSTFDCRARVPSGARALNGNNSNRIYGSIPDEIGVLATNSAAQVLTHNTPVALFYSGEIIDPKNQYTAGTTFQPADNGVYEIKGMFQVLDVPAGGQVVVRLQDISGGMSTLAEAVTYLAAGSPTVPFDFTEFLDPTHQYQVQVTLIDGAAQNRSLATTERSKRFAARRVA